MPTIFTVTNEDLGRLSPQEAVDIFRELLWAEATNIGLGKNFINVPSCITVADGGIDGEVSDAQVNGGQGIIKSGLTRYQIKTGDFSLTKSDIEGILFKKESNELKPRIKSCLDNSGTLVVVFFGWDNPDPTENQCCAKFKEILVSGASQYSNAKIEIWRQNTLSGFFQQFVSLSLKIKRSDNLVFQTHRSWSRQDDMQKDFKIGQPQKDFIAKIQYELRRQDEPVHIRVLGEPGIGKTRLVLEATRTEDLSTLVIYCDAASKFRDSDLMNQILRDDNLFRAILVIDECDPESRAYIWNKLKDYFKRIKLVTIYNDYDDTIGTTTYLNTPSLDREQISGIIQGYGILEDQADRWSEFCSGSPRVAHAFGWSLKNSPDDLLKSPDAVNLWDRYIVGGDKPDSQQIEQRRIVLRHLALFKKFGYGRVFIAEAQAISKTVEKVNTQITWGKFQEIISILRARRILQGENTLYISPKALHIKLWAEWWQTYGEGTSFEDLKKDLPKTLQMWSDEMFKYAEGSKVAQRIVKELLDEKGPFLR